MARIPLVPSELGLGTTPNDGTGSQLRAGGQVIRDWMADINSMSAELYEAAYAPRYVQFGAGNVKDMLSLDITGLLSDTYRMRAIVKGKIVIDNPGTGHPMYQGTDQAVGAYNQHILAISEGATTRVGLRRQAAAATVGQANCQFGGGATTSGGGNTLDVGDEFIAILSLNSGDNNGYAQFYKNGATSPAFTVSWLSAGIAVPLAACDTLAIGGTAAAVTGSSTNFYRGKLSEIRLWLTDDCHPIKLVTAQTGAFATVTAKTTDTNFTVNPGASIVVGATITNGTTAATATVSTFDPDTGVVTTGAWSAGALTVSDTISYTTETYDAAQLQAVLADEDPGATGAIGGVLPEVFFGRGQLPSEWNAGTNRGTLGAFDLDEGNIT
jgi:hypothetical protein